MKIHSPIIGLALIGSALLSGCKGKDSVVRLWIQDSLSMYLDSLAWQVCKMKYKTAPEIPGTKICPGDPEGHTSPPKNGKP
jgi:hypothetical protein